MVKPRRTESVGEVMQRQHRENILGLLLMLSITIDVFCSILIGMWVYDISTDSRLLLGIGAGAVTFVVTILLTVLIFSVLNRKYVLRIP